MKLLYYNMEELGREWGIKLCFAVAFLNDEHKPDEGILQEFLDTFGDKNSNAGIIHVRLDSGDLESQPDAVPQAAEQEAALPGQLGPVREGVHLRWAHLPE